MTNHRQYILIACAEKHFADPCGFREGGIREHLNLEHSDAFYEIRTVGGALGPVLNGIDRDWLIGQITGLVNGPISARAKDEPVDEVVLIITAHRSCGGAEAEFGHLFGENDELVALQGTMISGYREILDAIGDLNYPLDIIGLLLEHNGAVIQTAAWSEPFIVNELVAAPS